MPRSAQHRHCQCSPFLLVKIFFPVSYLLLFPSWTFRSDEMMRKNAFSLLSSGPHWPTFVEFLKMNREEFHCSSCRALEQTVLVAGTSQCSSLSRADLMGKTPFIYLRIKWQHNSLDFPIVEEEICPVRTRLLIAYSLFLSLAKWVFHGCAFAESSFASTSPTELGAFAPFRPRLAGAVQEWAA